MCQSHLGSYAYVAASLQSANILKCLHAVSLALLWSTTRPIQVLPNFNSMPQESSLGKPVSEEVILQRTTKPGKSLSK